MEWKVGKEYYDIINPILKSNEFQKICDIPHHGTQSIYKHAILVSKLSYLIAKKFKYDYKSAAIAGLLHDLYTTPWQGAEKKPFFKRHGFVHAKEALENSKKYFQEYMNPKIENAIFRHMFPLNIIPPKYKEAWIVTLSDKLASSNVLINPKILGSFIGLNSKQKRK